MNFYCYDPEEIIKKIKIKSNNITFHKSFSHECNYFLKEIEGFSKREESKNFLFFVPIIIKAKKETLQNEMEMCFYELTKNLKYFNSCWGQHVFFL